MDSTDQPRILAVCGYEPNPITIRKLDALHATGEWEIHLAYWRTAESTQRYPFSAAWGESRIHPIDVPPDLLGSSEWLWGLRGNVSLIRFHLGLRQVIRRVQPHLVHASNSNMLVGSWLYCLRHPARALVYDLLDTDDGMRSWPFAPVQRMMHRRVDHITVPSEQFISRFLRSFELIPDDCEPSVIANAPWRETFAAVTPRTAPAFVVGYIGSFRCPPAIEALIASVTHVRGQGANVELLFAGTGVSRALVERAAREHAFVTYTGPYDYRTDIAALYQRVDAVYGVYDGTADKATHLACRLSDAIASGRVIIAAKDTYMGSLVEQHGLGYTVDLANRATLDTALVDAAARRDEWRRPGRIPAWLRDEHLFEHYVPRLREIYRDALRSRLAG
jgi:glycosyltransferase involved in cell wall biosynthesis